MIFVQQGKLNHDNFITLPILSGHGFLFLRYVFMIVGVPYVICGFVG